MSELDDFKAHINPSEYAAAEGYVMMDRRASSRNSAVMRHQNGDKLMIAQGYKYWIYFSVRDDADNGTINTRYASIGGAMNPGQPALIASAIGKMQPVEEVERGFTEDG